MRAVKNKIVVRSFILFAALYFILLAPATSAVGQQDFLNSSLINNDNNKLSVRKENVELFEVVSPKNDTTWTTAPTLVYIANGVLKQIKIWLNNSQYEVCNNSKLPVAYRGCYNLTIHAVIDDILVKVWVHFLYLPDISVEVHYNAPLINEHFYPVNYSKPMPVYLFNETIEFYACCNEANNTLQISVYYGNYSNRDVYSLVKLTEGVNYTWINETVIKIVIEPNKNFSTYYHELLFVSYSSIDNSKTNVTFVFNRVYRCSIQIYPSEYQGFLNKSLYGLVSLRFLIYVDLAPAVNITIFLDQKLIKQMYTPEGYYYPEMYFTVDIDTTAYSNGIHVLEIYGQDFFNFTLYQRYFLTFANPTVTPHETSRSSLSLFTVIISILMFSSTSACTIAFLKNRGY